MPDTKKLELVVELDVKGSERLHLPKAHGLAEEAANKSVETAVDRLMIADMSLSKAEELAIRTNPGLDSGSAPLITTPEISREDRH